MCAACHSLKYVAFRDLADIGYNEGQVKTLAAAWPIEQPSTNAETGEAATRKNVPSDRFPSPYPNEIAARAANNNALPPDLSLMVKARHDGSDYIYSLLTGYGPQPAALVREFPRLRVMGYAGDYRGALGEIARRIVAIIGSDSEIHYEPRPIDDPERRKPDITKAREILGWQPTVPLEVGLARTIAWFQSTVVPAP